MDNKIKNANRRFKQGRLSYTKLRKMVGEEMRKTIASMKAEDFTTEDLGITAEEHVHGEGCEHHEHSDLIGPT